MQLNLLDIMRKYTMYTVQDRHGKDEARKTLHIKSLLSKKKKSTINMS